MSSKIPRNQSTYTRRVLAANPRVSQSVVAQSEELEENLKRLGVSVKPRYTLSPPLGESIRHFHRGVNEKDVD